MYAAALENTAWEEEDWEREREETTTAAALAVAKERTLSGLERG